MRTGKMRLSRSLQLEDERRRYADVLETWTADTFRRLMQEPVRLYAYYWASSATEYGKLTAVQDGQQPPAAPGGPFAPGWRLVTPEAVPTDKTRDQLYAWIKSKADYLPMYPHGKAVPRG